MPRMDLSFSVRFFGKGHSTVLLIALGLYLFVLHPLLIQYEVLLTILQVAFMLVLFSACYAIATSRRSFRLALTLALLTFAFSFAGEQSNDLRLVIVSDVLAILFFLWISLLLLRHVLGSANVTLDKIFGAICVYLIFGLMWSEIFTLLHSLNPNAFAFNDRLGEELSRVQHGGPFGVLVYYSFVTLSTLGYGDITPVSNGARAMASLEALVGPLYLAVLIARLVSQMEVKASPVDPESRPARRGR